MSLDIPSHDSKISDLVSPSHGVPVVKCLVAMPRFQPMGTVSVWQKSEKLVPGGSFYIFRNLNVILSVRVSSY